MSWDIAIASLDTCRPIKVVFRVFAVMASRASNDLTPFDTPLILAQMGYPGVGNYASSRDHASLMI